MIIQRKRTIFDMTTPFGEVPKEWLVNVEPYVARSGFHGCWMWGGMIDGDGHPIAPRLNRAIYKPLKIRPFVMRMFFDFPLIGAKVGNSCKNTLCVNPNHLFFIMKRDKTKVTKKMLPKSVAYQGGSRR